VSVGLRYNQLTLNLNKTCYTCFGKHVEHDVMPLLLQDKLTERANSSTNLGIYLDCKLSSSEHVTELCSKLSKLLGALYHIGSFINADMVRQLCYTYVFPHINFGIALYVSVLHQELYPYLMREDYSSIYCVLR